MQISTPLLQTLEVMVISRESIVMELKILKKIALSLIGSSPMDGALVLAQYTQKWVKGTLFHAHPGAAERTGILEGATSPHST